MQRDTAVFCVGVAWEDRGGFVKQAGAGPTRHRAIKPPPTAPRAR